MPQVEFVPRLSRLGAGFSLSETVKYATFYLSGIYFGLPAIAVQEVLEPLTIVPVPLAPAALPGVINLRGQILTVMDLRQRLQLGPREELTGDESRMAVIRTQEGLLTVLIDKVGEIRDVNSQTFESPAETIRPNVRSVVSHLCKLEGQLLLIMDIAKIVALEPTEPSHAASSGNATERTTQ